METILIIFFMISSCTKMLPFVLMILTFKLQFYSESSITEYSDCSLLVIYEIEFLIQMSSGSTIDLMLSRLGSRSFSYLAFRSQKLDQIDYSYTYYYFLIAIRLFYRAHYFQEDQFRSQNDIEMSFETGISGFISYFTSINSG